MFVHSCCFVFHTPFPCVEEFLASIASPYAFRVCVFGFFVFLCRPFCGDHWRRFRRSLAFLVAWSRFSVGGFFFHCWFLAFGCQLDGCFLPKPESLVFFFFIRLLDPSDFPVATILSPRDSWCARLSPVISLTFLQTYVIALPH